MAKNKEVIIYYSVGNTLCSDLQAACEKKKIPYKFVDIREIILHEDQKHNSKIIDKIEELNIINFPIVSIDGIIDTFYSSYVEDILHHIETKLKQKG